MEITRQEEEALGATEAINKRKESQQILKKLKPIFEIIKGEGIDLDDTNPDELNKQIEEKLYAPLQELLVHNGITNVSNSQFLSYYEKSKYNFGGKTKKSKKSKQSKKLKKSKKSKKLKKSKKSKKSRKTRKH